MPGGLTSLAIAITLAGGYLLGSIPFGMIATRLGGAGDIRKVGSGNIGATNVLRTGRRDLALITLLGDGGKGAAAALLARFFKGGKGVATFFGTLIAVAWPVGLLAGATWIAMAVIFRMSSLAALTAAALAPLYAFALHAGFPVVAMAAFMAILIYIRHNQNISRLLKGEEPKIGAKKAAEAK
jgi:glycerol-3-phosphate acyltransferase PlsY